MVVSACLATVCFRIQSLCHSSIVLYLQLYNRTHATLR